jgi:CRP/FNR family transcriptional regulator, cyclic AMP receptor protein
MSRSQGTQEQRSLKGIALFSGLSPDALARIQSRCRWHRCKPGESIVDYLEDSTDVFFIISGEARASIYSLHGKTVTFSDLSVGDVFGEIAAIDGRARSVSIEALTTCLVASMSAVVFRELVEAEPTLTQALLQHMAGTIRALTTRVYEFSTLAVNNRIQAEILRLAQLSPREGKTAQISVAPTHAEIASRISTHREAVSRELSRLSRIGILESHGRVIVVKDLDRLAALVHEVIGE